ncbi:hypothetical protein [Modestobacter sp. SYSU DS0290]
MDKRQVLELLLTEGNQTDLAEADDELPDTVDTEQDAELLRRIGLDPDALAARENPVGDGLLET